MQNESVVGSDAIYALVASVRSPRLCAHVHFFRYAYGRARAAGGRASIQGGQERGRSERSREDRGRSARLGGIGENEACGGNAGIRIMWKSTGFCFARSSAPHWIFKKGCVVISQIQNLKCEQFKKMDFPISGPTKMFSRAGCI